jgi:hypothetical protein
VIEWGALLGAMVCTLALLIDLVKSGGIGNWAGGCLATFALAPVFGAIWGALVAAAIHYVADGSAIHLLSPFFHRH